MEPRIASRPRRLAVRAAPVAAALLLLAGCSVGVEGTPGAAGLRDPYFPKLGNGGYDVRHYALNLAYDPKTGRLDATADITAAATQDLSAFNLDLSGLTVRSAAVDGAPAAFRRAGDELTIRPREELDKGTVFRTRLVYSGVPETVTDADGSEEGWLPTADGALAVGEPTGSMAWFPGNHHPSDKATYTVTLTVPAGLKAVSNGRLVSERTANGRTTAVWNAPEPMASYLATVAIGTYRTKTGTARAGKPADVPVLSVIDPAAADAEADALLARIPEILDWQSENFGPYPFSAAGAIVDRGGDLGYALETQTRPVFPRTAFDTATLVHELAHQWYGDSVTPETWRDMWLNEGFATYAEWLYAEDFEDIPAQESFDEAFADDANWAFPPADPPAAENISDAPVYGRGAMVLQKLRQTVGDDTFFEILRGWPAKYRYANASTDDFTAYVEETAGEDVAQEDLDEVWDVWLYGDGKPKSPEG
ncbi:M1 family metallopeptidase [Streptomyces sp. NPDC048604]|uniref:M1 family metallopeptidase n=1 Tax=Streptomyces sp. NPDC048604 TaxID=3365578 RepID=UPI003711189F